jgi:hypothetical protein
MVVEAAHSTADMAKAIVVFIINPSDAVAPLIPRLLWPRRYPQ